MTQELPAPLVPADCDLRDFQFMPLDVVRLRDSDLAALESADAFRAAVILWCVSWHQMPAASLPADDKVLCQLAGFGRGLLALREWNRVREGALRGWILCRDGRLYHEVVAEKAVESWKKKLTFSHARMQDRARKANKVRIEAGLPPLVAPGFDAWNAAGRLDPIPPEIPDISGGKPAEFQDLAGSFPPHKGREGTGKGQGKGQGVFEDSGPIGPGASAPPDAQDQLFAIGVTLLVSTGTPDRQARSFLALQAKTHGATAVVDALQRCAEEKPVQPIAWLTAALKTAPSKTANRQEALELRNLEVAERFARRVGDTA